MTTMERIVVGGDRTQSWVIEVLSGLSTQVPVLVSTPDGSVAQALAAAGQRAQLVVIGQPTNGRDRGLRDDRVG